MADWRSIADWDGEALSLLVLESCPKRFSFSGDGWLQKVGCSSVSTFFFSKVDALQGGETETRLHRVSSSQNVYGQAPARPSQVPSSPGNANPNSGDKIKAARIISATPADGRTPRVRPTNAPDPAKVPLAARHHFFFWGGC